MKIIALDITIAAQRKCSFNCWNQIRYNKKIENNVSPTKLVGKFAIDIKKQKYDIENYVNYMNVENISDQKESTESISI